MKKIIMMMLMLFLMIGCTITRVEEKKDDGDNDNNKTGDILSGLELIDDSFSLQETFFGLGNVEQGASYNLTNCNLFYPGEIVELNLEIVDFDSNNLYLKGLNAENEVKSFYTYNFNNNSCKQSLNSDNKKLKDTLVINGVFYSLWLRDDFNYHTIISYNPTNNQMFEILNVAKSSNDNNHLASDGVYLYYNDAKNYISDEGKLIDNSTYFMQRIIQYNVNSMISMVTVDINNGDIESFGVDKNGVNYLLNDDKIKQLRYFQLSTGHLAYDLQVQNNVSMVKGNEKFVFYNKTEQMSGGIIDLEAYKKDKLGGIHKDTDFDLMLDYDDQSFGYCIDLFSAVNASYPENKETCYFYNLSNKSYQEYSKEEHRIIGLKQYNNVYGLLFQYDNVAATTKKNGVITNEYQFVIVR